MKKMNKRLLNLDFIRALCAIGIICYHFSCHCNCGFKIAYKTPNYYIGDCIVTIFFILSGYSLYHNDSKIDRIGSFYYKRWKSIFPTFYIAYFFNFMLNVFVSRRFFYLKGIAPSWTLILSILGIDGYFSYIMPNYYILGDWFLGAIIILYLLYPIILYFTERRPFLTSLVILGAMLWVIFYNCFEIDPFRNIISCIFSFYVGILLRKYHKIIENEYVGIISIILFIVFHFVAIKNANYQIVIHLAGIYSFIALYWIGKIVMKNRRCKSIVLKGSRLSYSIFLLQHVIIVKVLELYNPVSVTMSLLLLLATIILTIISAWILNAISTKLKKSDAFSDFEKMILRTV